MANAPESESKLLLQAYSKSRDARARERLVQSYSPLVRRICRRFRGSVESQEDLFQVGVIGLLSAIDKCDPERGPSFASLAIPEVLGSILNYLRDHGSIIKVPRGLRRNKITVERVSDGLVHLLGHWPSASELALASGLTEAQVDATRVLARTAPPRSLSEKQCSKRYASLVECKDANYSTTKSRLL